MRGVSAKRVFLVELYRLPVRNKLFSIENEFQDRLLEVFSCHSHFEKSNFKELRTRTFILVHAVLGVLKSLTNRQDVDPDDLRKGIKKFGSPLLFKFKKKVLHIGGGHFITSGLQFEFIKGWE